MADPWPGRAPRRHREWKKGTTTLVITHCVSLSADVDRILVLDEGRIFEQGTPEQWMKQGSAFQQRIEKDKIQR